MTIYIIVGHKTYYGPTDVSYKEGDQITVHCYCDGIKKNTHRISIQLFFLASNGKNMNLRISNKYGSLTRNKFLTKSVTT
jgi:hypothetical protein